MFKIVYFRKEMVQDYSAPIREYDYDFDYVMEAYERRFGENGCPDIPIIKKLGTIFNIEMTYIYRRLILVNMVK